VGPAGRDGHNECLVTGTACMDALHPPGGLALPPWVYKRMAHNDAQQVLVLAQNSEYIRGGQTLPLAHQNGQ